MESKGRLKTLRVAGILKAHKYLWNVPITLGFQGTVLTEESGAKRCEANHEGRAGLVNEHAVSDSPLNVDLGVLALVA